jgi:hypothetical protein
MGWCGAREQQGEERASHLLAALSMLLDQAGPAGVCLGEGSVGSCGGGVGVCGGGGGGGGGGGVG